MNYSNSSSTSILEGTDYFTILYSKRENILDPDDYENSIVIGTRFKPSSIKVLSDIKDVHSLLNGPQVDTGEIIVLQATHTFIGYNAMITKDIVGVNQTQWDSEDFSDIYNVKYGEIRHDILVTKDYSDFREIEPAYNKRRFLFSRQGILRIMKYCDEMKYAWFSTCDHNRSENGYYFEPVTAKNLDTNENILEYIKDIHDMLDVLNPILFS